MKPLTVTQLRNKNIDFEVFYKNLRLYSKIIKVIELNNFTHIKYFLYRNNYFYTKQVKGEVIVIGTSFKVEPNYNEI